MTFMVKKFSKLRSKTNQPFKLTGRATTGGSGYKEMVQDLWRRLTIELEVWIGQRLGASVAKNLPLCYWILKAKTSQEKKIYLELKTKYEALLKKKDSTTYIVEEKCWDETDEDEDE